MARYFGNDASEAPRETWKHERYGLRRYATTIHSSVLDKDGDLSPKSNFLARSLSIVEAYFACKLIRRG